MYNYNTLCEKFFQYKQFLNYKYTTDKIVLNQIKEFLIKNNVTEITKNVTEEYARINSNISPNTLARNMGVFREFCKYLNLQGIPCYQIPNKLYPQNHNNFTPYIFSKKEIKKIYKNLNFIDKNYHYPYYKKVSYPLIIKILYQTGMRIGEVLKLTYNDYKENSYFILRDTKSCEERIVVLPNDLNFEFNNFYCKFKNCNEINDKIFNISYTGIEKYFHKLLMLSEIKKDDNGPRIHDLRHTFITHTIQKFIKDGLDLNNILPILKAYVGHHSIQSISYYFHMTNDILNELNTISEKNLGYLIPKVEEKIL